MIFSFFHKNYDFCKKVECELCRKKIYIKFMCTIFQHILKGKMQLAFIFVLNIISYNNNLISIKIGENIYYHLPRKL